MMPSTRSLLVLALPLLMAASDKQGGKIVPGEFASGALSYLVSKRCEKPSRSTAPSLEWPALTYGPGRPPKWGSKPAGPCRGLDTWVLQESLGAGAYWSQNDHAAIEADPNTTLFDDGKVHDAFKKAFGWPLPERGDYVPPPNVFLKLDGKKLSAMFDRIYVKPTDKIADSTGQEVYDVFFKETVARFAHEVALIKGALSKAQIGKQVKAYQAAAKEAGAKFQGPAFLRQVATDALPKDEVGGGRAYRTLGIILRRTADGSWPAINRLLQKVIKDYDPALAEELGKNL
jgi:hypothetical protein